MKTTRYLLLSGFMMVSMLTGALQAKNVAVSKLYMFGIAASFNDSIVYFTEVQAVDSAYLDSRKRFLQGRENYSYQLRDYLAQQKDAPHRTCIVFFDVKRQKLEKKFLKMKALYTTKAKQKFDLRYINENEFHFQAVNTNTDEDGEATPPPAKKKKRKNKKEE